MEITNREILIWLNSIRVNNMTIANIMKEIPQLIDLWHMSTNNIYKLRSINNKNAEKIINNRNIDLMKKTLYELEKKKSGQLLLWIVIIRKGFIIYMINRK